MTASEQHADPNEVSPTGGRREPPATDVAVPEYPALAANVELLGEMQETGFKESQWLARRGDRFIQLTELLYRVAETADGRSTHEEMAAGVTRSTDWLVEADDVRDLLRGRLIPAGLVASPEGEGRHADSVAQQDASPLRMNGRTRVLGPDGVDKIARVFGVLFAPFLLVPILVAVVLAHGWLYFVHGLGDAVRVVLYAPGLLLALVGVLFVSGIFHEFGHAAALRYGGGRAREMGFGLYLVYPALYTDTTDSYRLGRWARVRTDLGGFYFHLIFGVGLMSLSLITGWEWLLVGVLLINLDMIYQCMPFVRFDGYWALADLTGIPDFFSQMGAFLRSVLPLPRWKGTRLPNLKPWVKGVFAAYVLVTVPVLVLLLFNLITRLPDIVRIAWLSLQNQAADLSRASHGGDLVGAAVSVAQMLILGLQMLGITYLLYRLGRMVVRMILKRAARRSANESV